MSVKGGDIRSNDFIEVSTEENYGLGLSELMKIITNMRSICGSGHR